MTWRCWRHGHDDVLAFLPSRLALQCLTCGRLSPGWDLRYDPSEPFRRRLVADIRRARDCNSKSCFPQPARRILPFGSLPGR